MGAFVRSTEKIRFLSARSQVQHLIIYRLSRLSAGPLLRSWNFKDELVKVEKNYFWNNENFDIVRCDICESEEHILGVQ